MNNQIEAPSTVDISKYEGVGEKFDLTQFDACRKKAWELLHALSQEIQPSMKEADGHEAYKKLCQGFGVEKNWHPAKIRFGANSVKGFREVSDPDVVLQKSDIYFLDIGPVFFDHEGDVGKTFVLGSQGALLGDNSLHLGDHYLHLGSHALLLKAQRDSEELFKIVGDHWRTNKVAGLELYDFAEAQAKDRGWLLNLNGASGHRIGDFPHALFHRGSLREYAESASPNRWILEIQIRHPSNSFGAFFEDVLE